MKSQFRNLLLAAASLTLGVTAATGAPWPPAKGDLLLGVQATGSTGATTNVFFNLGPAHALRDNPNPAGVLVNLDGELTAAFGAGWAARTDLYFGVIGVRDKNPPIGFGVGGVAAQNGDPARTIYASRGTTVPGASIPWSGSSVSALGSAANNHHSQVDADTPAINHSSIVPNGEGVATVSQSANPVQWNNSWTKWNPVPGPAFEVFTGGIQAQMGNAANHVDLHRIVSTSGSGSYITTVSISNAGDVTVARTGAAATFFTATTNATNGAVSGGGAGILYASGSTAKLVAAPSTGFGFVNWTGDASGSANPLDLVMNANKTVTANFAPFPSVTSPTSTSITDTGATLGGNVTTDGGQTITERGVVVALNSALSDPQIDGSGVTKTTAAGTTGVFTTPVASLTAGTTYEFAAYATSAAGTGYSTVARFTTDTTITFTGGVGTLTGREILAGDTQLFRFNIADDTVADFSGTGATNTGWELRDSSNGLVASGTGNVAYADVLTSGDYTLRLTNTGGTAETVSLDLDASNAAEPKADVSVGGSGADVYAPVGQSTAATSVKANPVAVAFAVDNDGPLDDTFKVQGSGGDAFFTVTYMQGATNVTAQVIAGTYTTPSIAEGDAPVNFSMNVTPNKKKLIKKSKKVPGKKPKKPKTLKKTYTSTIKATASSNASLSDTATISVSTK